MRPSSCARPHRLARASAALLDCGVVIPAPAIAVLASGQGSNFEALAHAAARGELGGRIVLLLSDEPGAPALERARRLGIDARVLPCGRFRTRIEDERPWIETLRERGVGLVLLAGFMRRLHDDFLAAFPERVLNIHPSLLPAFPGRDAIERAWRHGVRITGCTVHLVTGELDGGPIVSQAAVEVRDGDSLESLAARVHAAEHRLYPATVMRLVTEPWRCDGRRIVFGEAASHGTGGAGPVALAGGRRRA